MKLTNIELAKSVKQSQKYANFAILCHNNRLKTWYVWTYEAAKFRTKNETINYLRNVSFKEHKKTKKAYDRWEIWDLKKEKLVYSLDKSQECLGCNFCESQK